MPRDFESSWAKDPRTLDELIAVALDETETGASDQAIAVLQFRGSRSEFDAGVRLSRSSRIEERCLAARILGQLGWSDQTFLDESVDVLIGLLDDTENDVVQAALYALGHRGEARTAERVAHFGHHSSDEIRVAVAHALGSLRPVAGMPASTLLELTRDPSRDVRDWATFAYRSAADDVAFGGTPLDSTAIREALVERADDEDSEIRGEAILALAYLGDPRANALLLQELARPLENDLVIEAAEVLKDPALRPALKSAWADLLDPETKAWFAAGHRLPKAYDACGGDPNDLG